MSNVNDAIKIEYDKENNVFIAYSNIIKGFVLENADRSELEKEIPLIAKDLIELNELKEFLEKI